MGKVGTGAKAGAVAGLAYGILDGILAMVTLIIFKADVMNELSKEASAESAHGITVTAAALYSLTLNLAVALTIIGGLIIYG